MTAQRPLDAGPLDTVPADAGPLDTGPPDTGPADACVHCGLCLPACPTYAELGNELDGPRGRIVLARALDEGRLPATPEVTRHFDLCLGCRACETACPSDVPYGAILAAARAKTHSGRGALLRRVLSGRHTSTWLFRGLAVARRLGLVTLARRGGRFAALARVAPPTRWTRWSHTVTSPLPATGERRGSVALLTGCVMDGAFGGVHAATVTLLRAAGFDVHVPRGPVCCGALHAHAGETDAAEAAVTRLSDALPSTVDHVVTNAAGCGSHLAESSRSLPAAPVDVLELLDRVGLGFTPGPICVAFGQSSPLRVAWDDPCHLLHGQGVHGAPRRLLASIPDVELLPLPDADRCCGGAGTYNVDEPEMAERLLAAKVEAIRDVAPDVLATANPGCQLQLEAGLREAQMDVPVVHAVELLAASRR